MAKQPKQNKSSDISSKEETQEAVQHSVVTNSVETPGPMSVEEISAIVRRDHEKIEEMHKYMKHLRWLSGIRLGITLFLIIGPIIFTIIALPPLLRGISSQLGGSGGFSPTDISSILETFTGGSGSGDSNGQVNYVPEDKYPDTLSQPPADYNSWSKEQQEQWVKEQFDGKDFFR